MKYFFIFNGSINDDPSAAEALKQLDACVANHAFGNNTYDTYRTKGTGDATRFVRIYCDLHAAEKVCFVACGGDSFISEVAEGLVGSPDNKSMAIFTVSTNERDIVRYYPNLKFDDLESLLKGAVHNIDIIKVNDNYSLNICNFGFDSVVGSTAHRRIEEGKPKPYEWGILKALFMGRYNRIRVEADGKKISRWLMLLCTLANGRYIGDGFLCAPRSKNDDGLIDVCLIHPLMLIAFFILLSKYRKGTHLDHPFFSKHLTYCQARHIEVSASHIIELCLDGNMLPGQHFNIDILPGAIRLRLPQTTTDED